MKKDDGIGFKLAYEEIKMHINTYKGPSKGAIAFEDVLFAAGRQLVLWTVWLYYFCRLQLKHALWSTSVMLFILYNRL